MQHIILKLSDIHSVWKSHSPTRVCKVTKKVEKNNIPILHRKVWWTINKPKILIKDYFDHTFSKNDVIFCLYWSAKSYYLFSHYLTFLLELEIWRNLCFIFETQINYLSFSQRNSNSLDCLTICCHPLL